MEALASTRRRAAPHWELWLRRKPLMCETPGVASINRASLTLHGAFVLTGIVTTMLGPLMPALQARWQIADARAGLLFTAQFLASVCSAAAVGVLAQRFGYAPLIRCGLLLAAAGVAGCAAASWPLALLCVAVYGCGLGLLIPAGNLGIAALHPGAESRQVMLLNLSWCAGAVAAPLLVASLGGIFLWTLSASIVFGAALCGAGEWPERRGGAVGPTQFGRLPLLLTSILLFLYVGTESAIGGWVALLTLRESSAQNLWAILPSVFWAGMLAGRMVAPALLAKVRPSGLVICGLLAAFAGAAFLIAGHGSYWSVAAGVLSGLGLAPVYPLVVAQYAELVAADSTSGLIFSAGGLGGAALPALVGFLSQRWGDLRTGLCLVLLCLAAMIWLQLRLAHAFRYSGNYGISG
jgi:fucose permease